MSRRLDERAARVAKIRDRNTRLDAAHARHLEEAHARWRDGYLLPWRITMWLDRLRRERLATAPRWLPVAHLPPSYDKFYPDEYLRPLQIAWP